METVLHLLGPLHPLLVHFPVACPILAFLALLGSRFLNKKWLLDSAALLWILTFLSALGALLTGHLFSLHLGLVSQFSLLPPESAAKGHLRDHALLGLFSIGASLLALAAAVRILQKRPWPFPGQMSVGLLTAVLFAWTGHEGGEMVYGPGDISPAPVSAASQGGGPFKRAEDYRKNLVQMNARAWNSRTHGHRWVNVFVSPQAVEAYKNQSSLPTGSLVVKESFENDHGKPATLQGPLYVMEKGEAAQSPGTGGWRYALKWENPAPGNPEHIQGPVTWLPGDPGLASCVRCHNHFKANDYMGGVPEGFGKK